MYAPMVLRYVSSPISRCVAPVLRRQDKGLGTNLPVVYVPRDMSTSRCKGAEKGGSVEGVSKLGHICTPPQQGSSIPRNKVVGIKTACYLVQSNMSVLMQRHPLFCIAGSHGYHSDRQCRAKLCS